MRPKIICHMVSSIDGRLLPDRWTPPARGVAHDIVRRLYEESAGHFDADGWIVGRVTMEDLMQGRAREIRTAPVAHRMNHVGDRRGRRVAVAVDPQGRLHYGTDEIAGDHIVAVLGEAVSDAYLAELREDGVSYVFAGRDGHDLPQAMCALGSDFGLKTLLLEGGGRINGAFLKRQLIDEISMLVYPGIDGLAGVPSIVDYAGGPDEKPAAGRALRHLATETLEGGMVWMRYRLEAA